MVYEKVSSDMNFVDREKQVEKFWKDNDIFQKSIDNRKKGETIHFMMDLLQLMVSHISDMFLQEL